MRVSTPSVGHHLAIDACQTDPDLAIVADAWDRLPEAVRAGIVAMVKAASPVAASGKAGASYLTFGLLASGSKPAPRVPTTDYTFTVDVAYDSQAQDRQLLAVMKHENRALLTRDRRLLMHAIVKTGYYPRSQNANEQTIEVIRRFDLLGLIDPFMRCLRCNAPLQGVAKADIMEKLEPLTKIYYEQFRRCTGCRQIYWAGSHFTKLQRRLEQIRTNFGS